jgi:hypothetical protein
MKTNPAQVDFSFKKMTTKVKAKAKFRYCGPHPKNLLKIRKHKFKLR